MRKDTVRRLALSLPEATEQESWGTPTFRVRKKIFAMFGDEQRECWVKSIHDEQRALFQMDPETFFVPPYVGPSGWVGVRIATVDRDEMRGAARGGLADDRAEAARGRLRRKPRGRVSLCC